jgi:inositol-1,3,4-trisphosphate 5/6-kinase/inositol-tetrakisphosphate 1-kinase
VQVANKKRPRQAIVTTLETPVPVVVTVEEIMPVVNALKQAFGLELFGFDVLIVSDQATMLVVDVNYFPSYKEVSNFPSLLAQYLMDRAIHGRRQAMEMATEKALGGDD